MPGAIQRVVLGSPRAETSAASAAGCLPGEAERVGHRHRAPGRIAGDGGDMVRLGGRPRAREHGRGPPAPCAPARRSPRLADRHGPRQLERARQPAGPCRLDRGGRGPARHRPHLAALHGQAVLPCATAGASAPGSRSSSGTPGARRTSDGVAAAARSRPCGCSPRPRTRPPACAHRSPASSVRCGGRG